MNVTFTLTLDDTTASIIRSLLTKAEVVPVVPVVPKNTSNKLPHRQAHFVNTFLRLETGKTVTFTNEKRLNVSNALAYWNRKYGKACFQHLLSRTMPDGSVVVHKVAV